MPGTLKRYREIRLADVLDDQQGSVAIAAAVASSVTQEDYQVFQLSRLRQILFGNVAGTPHWYDDFLAQEIPSLRDSAFLELLTATPSASDTTYSNTKVGSQVMQELWVRTATSMDIKKIDYTYFPGTSRVATEQTQVLAMDGTTVVAQTTSTYSYTGSSVTGIATTRDI